VTRLFVLARHGESTLKVTRVVNGDPAVDVPLTEKGREESALVGRQLCNVPLDLCLVTRFGRTRETAEIALDGRDVPLAVEPLFDDVDVGELEGASLDEYRAWKRAHTHAEPFRTARAWMRRRSATAGRSSPFTRARSASSSSSRTKSRFATR
jgi:broad specificity phosphatase PhoE